MKKCLLLMVSIALSGFLAAQTPGLIVKSAGTGATVLDPDGDGYVSNKTNGLQIGFTNPPNSDYLQTEIPYAPIVKSDTVADLLQGPGCHFSDIVGEANPDQYAISTYYDGTNLMFRMRMANYVPNSKTYSILIDTDIKYGFTGPNADPNALPGNPGFEIEIAMITNFGVNVYAIDGTTTPTLIASNPYNTHSQMSVALSRFCDSPDYFYDFYVPFSQIEAIPALNVTTATPLRFSFNTNMRPAPSTGSNSISDEAGVPEDQNPTPVDSINEGVDEISDCPPINQVYTASEAITGYSTEESGTLINVYIYAEDGLTQLSTASTYVSAGSWSITMEDFSPSILLAEGMYVKATATAAEKATSFDNCDTEVVFKCIETTASPTADEIQKLANANGYQITTSRPMGTLVYIYNTDYTLRAITDLKRTANPYSTKWSPQTFYFECKDDGCFSDQVYIFRMEEPGKCISEDYFSCDYASALASDVPVITSNPLTIKTTSVQGTASSASAQILVYVNGDHQMTVNADASAPYAFTAALPALELGDLIELRQIELGKCISDIVSIGVTRQAYTPIIMTSECLDSTTITTVKGTSVEAAGTEITVFGLNPSRTVLGSDTVLANGTWIVNGLSLHAGDQITAAVTAGVNLTQSADADTVIFTTKTDINLYTITIDDAVEGATSVSGTMAGSAFPVTLYLYIDDALIGEVEVSVAGEWTVSALNTFDLTTGGRLNVSLESDADCESAYSPSTAMVLCAAPAAFEIASDTLNICDSTLATIRIENSQEGIYYEPVLVSDSSSFGYGQIGNGGLIVLNTYAITADVAVTVMASRLPIGSCIIYADNAVEFQLVVIPAPPVAAVDQTLCFNSLINDISIALGEFESANWYDSPIDGNIIDPQTPLVDGMTYYSEAQAYACLSESRTAVTVTLDIVPDTSYWTGEYDTDFNNDLNWTKGSPGYCSFAIITNLDDKYYPIISDSATVDAIFFEPGAAVLGLEHLNYNQAFVEASLQRNVWYTLTAPLKNMYSGDYNYNGDPRTFMQLFDAINPDKLYGAKAVGTWTASFSSLTVPLWPGMGFAYLVDSFSYNYPNGGVYELDPFTVQFPRTDVSGELITAYHPISGLSGKTYSNIDIPAPKDTFQAYRFAMEDENNVLQDVLVPIKPGLNLVGNPMMSHLDFTKLYASNSSIISNKVKFWNGSTFTTYMVGSEIASDMDLDYTSIPPMQSFFVEGVSAGNMLIDLDQHFVADTLTKLRSARIQNSVMHIKASMGDKHSYTAVAMNPLADNDFGSDDAFKLFTHYSDVPDVYTMAEFNPLDINQFRALPYMTPVGINTTAKGNVNLKFFGAESFAGVDVILMNTETGEQQNLKLDDEYTIYSNGTSVEGTLFVEFRNAEALTLNSDQNACYGKCVQVYADDHRLFVQSSPDDKIKKISVWEELGLLLYRTNNLSSSSFDIKLDTESSVCVARVETESGIYVVKVMMK